MPLYSPILFEFLIKQGMWLFVCHVLALLDLSDVAWCQTWGLKVDYLTENDWNIILSIDGNTHTFTGKMYAYI